MTDVFAQSPGPDRGIHPRRRLPLFLAAFGLGFAVGLVGILSSGFALGSGDAVLRFMLWPSVLAVSVGLIGALVATAANKPSASTVSGVSFAFLIGLWTPVVVILAVILVLIGVSNSRRQ